MRLAFLIASLCVGSSLGSSLAFAQALEPKLPAMPSMDQKGSDDLSKPAGAEKPASAPAAPKPPPKDEAKAPSPPAKPPVAKAPVAKPHASKASHAKSGHAPKTRAQRKRK